MFPQGNDLPLPELPQKARGSPSMRYLLCACLGLVVGILIGASFEHSPIATAEMKLRGEALVPSVSVSPHEQSAPVAEPQAVTVDPPPAPVPAPQAATEPQLTEPETTGTISQEPTAQAHQVPRAAAAKPSDEPPSRPSGPAPSSQPPASRHSPPAALATQVQQAPPFRMTPEDLQRARQRSADQPVAPAQGLPAAISRPGP